MEIIIGYILGFIVLSLLFISFFKSISSRIKSTNSKIKSLEKRVKELEEHR